MVERLSMWCVGAAVTTLFSTALLALPAVIAAHRLAARRAVAPLSRDWLESSLVLSAAALGAFGALVYADGCALALGPYTGSQQAAFLASFVAPAPLAAVSWVAGELLSGPSERPVASFLAAAAVSCVTSWIGFAVVWRGQPSGPLTTPLLLIQIPATFASALLAAKTYVAVRGVPRAALPAQALELERAASDYSSSMSENRSLRGGSSGFFWPGAGCC